jgi:hypothetical protein
MSEERVAPKPNEVRGAVELEGVEKLGRAAGVVLEGQVVANVIAVCVFSVELNGLRKVVPVE